jgi:type VII secretion-associated serine protease mycosin
VSRSLAAGGLAVALVAALVAAGPVSADSSCGPGDATTASVGAPERAYDAVRDREYWLDDYGIRTAWGVTRGAGVTIAVIDTGVDGSVAELRGVVVDGTDVSGLGSSNGQTPVGADGSEHGTMVASLAAGRGTGANAGVIGSAPEASVLSISIAFGGNVDSDAEIADAVRWATDHGADVINMSLTRNTLEWPTSWDDAFLYAMDHDVVILAAAGNRGSGTVEVGAPATMPGVLTVAGVDRNGVSSWDASAQGITIGVSAPSEDLVGVVPGGGHVTWSGTSGATPIVAGIVALVRAAHPELDAANVIQRVVATARDAGPTGSDFTYGYGLVDAAAAVSAQVAPVSANPMGDLNEWVRVNRRATASPAPTATLTPTPAPVAVAAPAEPSGLIGTLLPSVTLLQVVGLPTLVFALIVFVWAGFIVGAVRYFRWLRRAR